MTDPAVTAAIRRVAYTRAEAAASIGVSVDTFERFVQPHVPLLRLGRKVLVPVAALEEWVNAAAEKTIRSGPARSSIGSNIKRPRAAGTAGGMAQGERTP